jgi:glycosyltransferase involved in cell wall biosynthesis
VEGSVLRLVGALAADGTSITVVAPAESGAVHERDGAVIVHVGFGDRLSLARGMRPWRRRAVKAIMDAAPDLVHGQGILTGGLPACDAEALPRVVTVRGNARQDTLAAYPGLAGRVRAGLRDRLAREVVRRADAIVGVHPDWRVNLPTPPVRFVHIPNMVEPCFFDATPEPEPGLVLYCGGPARIKGFDLLLEAWPVVRRAVPDARLRATGWDVAALPSVSPGDGITVLPGLPPTQVAAEMAKASLVVIPSRYAVTPNVLSEAWAVGVPVVATAAGGLATLAPGAATLVPPEDPGELGAAIVRVLGGDEDAVSAVAEGRRRAGLRTPGAIAASHRSLYEELLASDA